MKKIKPKIEKKTTLNEILTNQLLQNAVKDKDDGYLKNTCNEIFDMVQKPPMKDLKINLKQKNVADDDIVNIQFVGDVADKQ